MRIFRKKKILGYYLLNKIVKKISPNFLLKKITNTKKLIYTN